MLETPKVSLNASFVDLGFITKIMCVCVCVCVCATVDGKRKKLTKMEKAANMKSEINRIPI